MIQVLIQVSSSDSGFFLSLFVLKVFFLQLWEFILPAIFLWLGFDIITLVNDIRSGVMIWVSGKNLETICIVIDAL